MIEPKIYIKRVLRLSMDINSIQANWHEFLYDMGMWTIFKKIYDNDNIEKSNIFVSFISLAYSPYSDLVHLHKDRSDNKKSILNQICPIYKDLLSEDEINSLIFHQERYHDNIIDEDADIEIKEDSFLHKYLSTVSEFINWHRDSKYKNWINLKEFISINSTYATTPASETQQVASKAGVQTIKTPDNVIAFTAIKKADLMAKCSVLEERANKHQEYLRRHYADLDAIVDKEIDNGGIDIENYNNARMEDRIRRDSNL